MLCGTAFLVSFFLLLAPAQTLHLFLFFLTEQLLQDIFELLEGFGRPEGELNFRLLGLFFPVLGNALVASKGVEYEETSAAILKSLRRVLLLSIGGAEERSFLSQVMADSKDLHWMGTIVPASFPLGIVLKSNCLSLALNSQLPLETRDVAAGVLFTSLWLSSCDPAPPEGLVPKSLFDVVKLSRTDKHRDIRQKVLAILTWLQLHSRGGTLEEMTGFLLGATEDDSWETRRLVAWLLGQVLESSQRLSLRRETRIYLMTGLLVLQSDVYDEVNTTALQKVPLLLFLPLRLDSPDILYFSLQAQGGLITQGGFS